MRNRRKNIIVDKLFEIWGLMSSFVGIILLLFFIGQIFADGIGRIDWDFLTSLPSRKPENSGIYTAMLGSVWLLVLTALFSFPLGVMAGIYLEEYQEDGVFAYLLEVNITNLAAVPSIIYGLLGLEIFVRAFMLDASLLAGALTLSLLILPIIIVTTREAIRTVPQLIKDASYALGATKWQTIWHQTLPASFGGILTGVILALSRAVGEAAPLIVVGALAYVPFAPSSPLDQFSAMPIQIFNWISRPQAGFAINAAAAIIILLIITFMMNAFAMYLRYKWQKKIKY